MTKPKYYIEQRIEGRWMVCLDTSDGWDYVSSHSSEIEALTQIGLLVQPARWIVPPRRYFDADGNEVSCA